MHGEESKQNKVNTLLLARCLLNTIHQGSQVMVTCYLIKSMTINWPPSTCLHPLLFSKPIPAKQNSSNQILSINRTVSNLNLDLNCKETTWTIRSSFRTATGIHCSQFSIQDKSEPSVTTIRQLQGCSITPDVQAVPSPNDWPVSPVIRFTLLQLFSILLWFILL